VRACEYPGAWACICVFVRVALLIQHATRMRHIVTSFAVPLAPPYFFTLSHKSHDFRKNFTEYKMCVLILSTAFDKNISHSKKKLARNYHKCENFFM
jgi:predicted transcriptional regulator